MTQKSVDDVLKKAATDAEFRSQLAVDPDKALAPYRDRLTDKEIEELKSLSPEVLSSISRLKENGAEGAAQRWYLPGSFREFGGALLSIILLVLLLIVAVQTFNTSSAAPTAIEVGDQVIIIDPYERSKDLLNLFFPLFSAVVTFWLGVAVEGRRADKSEAEADQARQNEQEAREDQIQAEAEAAGTKATAKATLAQVKAAVRHVQSVTQSAAPAGGLESLGSLGVSGAAEGSAAPADDPLASALAAIDSAEQQLR
jgi:hypothetical protein